MEWTDLNRSIFVMRTLLATTLPNGVGPGTSSDLVAPAVPKGVAYRQITNCLVFGPKSLALSLCLDDRQPLPASLWDSRAVPGGIEYFLGQPLWRSLSVPAAMFFDGCPEHITHLAPFVQRTMIATVTATAPTAAPERVRIIVRGYSYSADDLILLEPDWKTKIPQFMTARETRGGRSTHA